MRAKTLLVLGLAIVLALGTVAVVGCGGGDEDAKAALRAALDTVETKVSALTTSFTAGGTVPELKAAKDDLAADWEAVVTAAKGVDGADVAAAEKAWTDLDTAVDGLSDDATLVEAGTAIMGPVQALLAQATALGELAGASE